MQSLISGYDFKKLVTQYQGDKGIRVLSVSVIVRISSDSCINFLRILPIPCQFVQHLLIGKML